MLPRTSATALARTVRAFEFVLWLPALEHVTLRPQIYVSPLTWLTLDTIMAAHGFVAPPSPPRLAERTYVSHRHARIEQARVLARRGGTSLSETAGERLFVWHENRRRLVAAEDSGSTD